MALKLISDEARLTAKYRIVCGPGCWDWIARLDRDGYGAAVKIGSRSDGTRRGVRPHRWFYEHFIKPIPGGLVIDHLCRNRKCMNPWHMEPVTALVNHERGLRAKYTVCPRGHAIEGENERKRTAGTRCRICHNAYLADYHRRTGHKHSNAYKLRKRSEKSALAIG